MGAMASQITSLTIVYAIVHSGADQGKHQSPVSLAFVQGIHRWPVNSPHKWPVTRKVFPFDDVIMIWWCALKYPVRYEYLAKVESTIELLVTVALFVSSVIDFPQYGHRKWNLSLSVMYCGKPIYVMGVWVAFLFSRCFRQDMWFVWTILIDIMCLT